eukprot:gb/GFBE01024109.1/.p1 GENE.gb/GFBE01024109.1/~~gb/GFBE01024109.1/.p1  ORF type:complete len:175 (+),score=43.02 gb/GFBE01024109.1/:1-525(+)
MAFIGDVLAYAGTVTSVFSLIIGIIFLAKKFPSFDLKFSTCYFEDPDEYTYWVDCNSKWSSNWGMVGIVVWVPFLMGLFGTFMLRPMLLEVVGFPRNFLQYGLWLIIQAMFGNMGYCGKLGVICGFASIALGLVCIVAAAFGIKSHRMEQMEKLRKQRYAGAYSSQEDSNEESD